MACSRRIFTRPFRGRELVRAMLGVVAPSLEHEARSGTTVVLAARGVRTRPGAQPFDLDVRAGEIVGLTGLVGAGKTEVLEQLYGARPLVSGDLMLDGRPYRPASPADAVRAGVALVAEERGPAAVVPVWSVRHHVTLPRLRRHSRGAVLSTSAERRSAAAPSPTSAWSVPGIEAELTELSGGNQQKVLVGRWFDGRSRLVLLDEPFRGVDVGARADIARPLRERASDIGIVVASSDPAEVVQVADRVVVVAGGDVTGELSVADVTAHELSGLMAIERAARQVDRVRRECTGVKGTLAWFAYRYGLLVVLAGLLVCFSPYQAALPHVGQRPDHPPVGGDRRHRRPRRHRVDGRRRLRSVRRGQRQLRRDGHGARDDPLRPRRASAAIVAGLLAGLLVAAVNTALIILARVPDLVATLGTMFIFQGLALIITVGKSVSVGMPIGDGEVATGQLHRLRTASSATGRSCRSRCRCCSSSSSPC